MPCGPSRTEYPPPKEGEPPLHRAARLGDHGEIRRLVAAGARLDEVFNTEQDPGAYDREATPLMVAAGSSDGASEETIRLLLELGADPKIVIAGRSVATFACEGLSCWYRAGGDAGRLRAVLAAGCPLPENPERANRLLCDTAASGDAERLRVLLEHGLSPRGHFDAEKSRASHAAMLRSTDGANEALAGIPEEMRAAMEETSRKMTEAVFEQMSSGPSSYELPLFRAAESGSAECVGLLLATGADAATRDNMQRTAMYCAGSVEVARALLAAGLTLEDSDTYGWSPLLEAVNDGDVPRVRALVEAGADVNASHDRGYTVFMSAVGSGRVPEVLRLLVGAGADPHAVSELGYNAFHAAIDVNFEANAEESVRDTLGYLKELGVNIEQRNAGGHTPLARALQEGTGLEVRVLCELGADASAVCPKHQCGGGTCTRVDEPLLFHAATGIGVDKVGKVEALLRAGADPLRKDAEGFRALERVAASLCSDAEDYDAAYEVFFTGLDAARPVSVARARDEFLADITPSLREYVERFAAGVPIRGDSGYEKEWRAEKVSSIVHLCAFERWDRRRRSLSPE